MTQIQVFSEIGQLKKVLVHRPGRELNNLSPDWMESLLFDELPYLKAAQEEHDAFTAILQRRGVEVVYLESLLADVLAKEEDREELLTAYLAECELRVEKEAALFKEFLQAHSDPYSLALRLMEGTRVSELPSYGRYSLSERVAESRAFVAPPMPNLYFTRDPFSFIGRGVSLNRMWSPVRNRETLFGKFILERHPLFAQEAIPHWYNREEEFSIEGGDILVLSEDTLAVGVSQRTQPQAVEALCRSLFQAQSGFQRVLAFVLPKKREFMHLDTVFTMIDKNLFTLHPLIRGPLEVYCLEPDDEDGRNLRVKEEHGALDEVLARTLGVPSVKLIHCGGEDPLDAAREQWNDGSNTLAIAPREVVVYDRNEVTNALLREAGVRVHEMPSGELSRGRGGPRCMSMPLWRERLTY